MMLIRRTPRINRKRDAKILAMIQAGEPMKAIAAQFKLTVPRIYQIRNKYANRCSAISSGPLPAQGAT
jgi:hypothetical protein